MLVRCPPRRECKEPLSQPHSGASGTAGAEPEGAAGEAGAQAQQRWCRRGSAALRAPPQNVAAGVGGAASGTGMTQTASMCSGCRDPGG